MKKQSAGLLVYKIEDGQIKVLIAHMGSPWWANKDKGAWTIPKGGLEEGEEPIAAARREFKEELGYDAPAGELIELGSIDQKNNKTVTAWAVEGDVDTSKIVSNTFEAEWPPRSGKTQEYPEVDRAAYFNLDEAAEKLIPEQIPLLERLAERLKMPWAPKAAKSENPQQNTLF